MQITLASHTLTKAINVMERSVRQTLILGDKSLLEGYFQAHTKFEKTTTNLFQLSLRTEQKQMLEQLQLLEIEIFQKVSAASQAPEKLRELDQSFQSFALLLDFSRSFSDFGYALIELEMDGMRKMAEDAHTVMLWELFALIPFAVLLVLGFSWLITRPIRQIDGAIRNMGQGELSKTILVDGPQDLMYLGERLDWMRRRLLKLEEQKTRFLQHVSHELKTPLTSMREGANLLAEGVVGELTVKQQQIANIIHSNSIQLQKRIEDLLNYSALQTEKSAFMKHQANLTDILSVVLQDHNLAIMNKNLKIDLACTKLVIDCDEQKIRIIIDNLLSNAIKFSPLGSRIKISATQLTDSVQLDIIDAGSGIDDVDQDKVFEPFYQGRIMPDSHVQGTGLGLSIAREYALSHGGNIDLVQTTKEGAHFRLTLPIHDPESYS
ncbi:HAMP domain-containing sensor histidine kinase [Candidatus Nitrotoga sp. M5]|uniref:HAMP domain-containing sensor histidine kinase n=1 Tax=Candidatus Nitrotoga sp. M5 TaxID=2890409 RepID=UPI001EF32BF0|nr:HAMP domain-containing sensor histidine kinase [Candidatus Nitrotoga sp. M5]